MPYTLFSPGGAPLRSSVAVDGWILECSFHSGRTPAPPTRAAHELTHTVQQDVTVRGWNAKVKQEITGPGSPRSRSFIPEVDDEVLVAFEGASPRSSAIIFNPTEFTISKSIPWGNRAVPVAQGLYRIVIRQRGPQPLALSLAIARSSTPGVVDIVRIA